MMVQTMSQRAARFFILTMIFAPAATSSSVTLSAQQASPFAALAGRWTGEGRLGLKDSPPETVKCRATYFLTDGKDELKQNIRCASAGGSIEVQSQIENAAGVLSGHWKETTRNLEGDLTGAVKPNGLRIVVKGGDLTANMDILVRDNKQVVEIQFINSALVGLSLLMTKG